MNHAMTMFTSRHHRRGSVYLMTISILAILGVFSMTFAYTIRMELLASRNWADSILMKAAVSSKIPLKDVPPRPVTLSTASVGDTDTASTPTLLGFTPQYDQLSAYVGFLPSQLTPKKTSSVSLQGVASPESVDSMSSLNLLVDMLSAMVCEDESAKININAIVFDNDPSLNVQKRQTRRGSRIVFTKNTAEDDPFKDLFAFPCITTAQFAQFIKFALHAGHVSGNAEKIANAIVARRLGPDAILNHERQILLNDRRRFPSLRETSVLQILASDPRFFGYGDDRPFLRLEELLELPEITPEIYRVLAPYLTTLSVSKTAFIPESEESDSSVNDTGIACVDANEANAKAIYAALQQRFPDAPSNLLAQYAVNIVDYRDLDDIPTALTIDDETFYGFEVHPLINEVCPDVISETDSKDNGQFIELYNPYTRTLSLVGWSIRLQNGSFALRGSMPPGGLLVLTDDYNNDTDPNPEHDRSVGSLYAIFGVVAHGDARRIDVYPQLDLPDDSGWVQLVNPEGIIVDEFRYSGARYNGRNLSCQRKDPRLRAWSLQTATPLAPNQGQNRLIDPWRMNQSLLSPLDLLFISTSYAATSDRLDSAHNWSRAVDASNIHAYQEPIQGASTGLDAGVVDCFFIGPDAAYGRLNLNTASLAALSVLPEISSALLYQIYEARREFYTADDDMLSKQQILSLNQAAWWSSLDPLKKPCWHNLSDFIKDNNVFGDLPLLDRVQMIYPFANLLTTHSSTVSVVTDSVYSETQQAKIRSKRQLACDRGFLETVGFEYLKNLPDQPLGPSLLSMANLATATQSTRPNVSE